MDIVKLQQKIEQIEDKKIAANLAKALCNSPEDFQSIVTKWMDGEESEYSYAGISLSAIRQKEHCSYFNALLRMNILINDPISASTYSNWVPIVYDGRR